MSHKILDTINSLTNDYYSPFPLYTEVRDPDILGPFLKQVPLSGYSPSTPSVSYVIVYTTVKEASLLASILFNFTRNEAYNLDIVKSHFKIFLVDDRKITKDDCLGSNYHKADIGLPASFVLSARYNIKIYSDIRSSAFYSFDKLSACKTIPNVYQARGISFIFLPDEDLRSSSVMLPGESYIYDKFGCFLYNPLIGYVKKDSDLSEYSVYDLRGHFYNLMIKSASSFTSDRYIRGFISPYIFYKEVSGSEEIISLKAIDLYMLYRSYISYAELQVITLDTNSIENFINGVAKITYE